MVNLQELQAAGDLAAQGLVGRVVLGLVAAILAWGTARWARSMFNRLAARRGVDPSARVLGVRLLHGFFIALGIIWVLEILGVQLTVVVATLGVAGLAFSLAVQDILKSFFAGLYLLFERPFLIGDEIQIKEHIGKVEDIGFRSISLRTAENVLVVIPNSLLFTEPISNRSQRRVPADVPRPEGR